MGARSTSFSALSTSYLVPSACSHALPGTKFSLMSFQTMADVLVSRRFFTEQLLIMPRGSDSKFPAPAQAATMISNHNLNEYAWSTCFDPQCVFPPPPPSPVVPRENPAETRLWLCLQR